MASSSTATTPLRKVHGPSTSSSGASGSKKTKSSSSRRGPSSTRVPSSVQKLPVRELRSIADDVGDSSPSGPCATRTSPDTTASDSSSDGRRRDGEHLFSVDGGVVIPSFQVEIQTDGVGSVVSRSSAASESKSGRPGSGKMKKKRRPGTAGGGSGAQNNRTIPRFAYSESLRSDIVEHYDLVKYRHDEEEESEHFSFPSAAGVFSQMVDVPDKVDLQRRSGAVAANGCTAKEKDASTSPSKSLCSSTSASSPPSPEPASPMRQISALTEPSHWMRRQSSLQLSAVDDDDDDDSDYNEDCINSSASGTITPCRPGGTSEARQSENDKQLQLKAKESPRHLSTGSSPFGLFCATGLPWFDDGEKDESSVRRSLPTVLENREQSFRSPSTLLDDQGYVKEGFRYDNGVREEEEELPNEPSSSSGGHHDETISRLTTESDDDLSSIPWYTYRKLMAGRTGGAGLERESTLPSSQKSTQSSRIIADALTSCSSIPRRSGASDRDHRYVSTRQQQDKIQRRYRSESTTATDEYSSYLNDGNSYISAIKHPDKELVVDEGDDDVDADDDDASWADETRRTALYLVSPPSVLPKGVSGCVPVLHSILRRIDDAERAVLGEDRYFDVGAVADYDDYSSHNHYNDGDDANGDGDDEDDDDDTDMKSTGTDHSRMRTTTPKNYEASSADYNSETSIEMYRQSTPRFLA